MRLCEREARRDTVEMETKITVQNVVASASFKQTFDLNAIFMAFPDAEYRPNVFPGLVFRLKKPKTCTLIFRSGKMVCTGAKSERMARGAVLKVARELKNAGIAVPGWPEIKIANIVASIDLGGMAIDLPGLYEAGREFRGSVIYEPEQFPGVMFRMKNPRVVFLIFSSGKLVCAGAKREKDVYEATDRLVAMLEERGIV